jgi:hypothetical protein
MTGDDAVQPPGVNKRRSLSDVEPWSLVLGVLLGMMLGVLTTSAFIGAVIAFV